MTPEQYVAAYKDMAMLEMRRTGVPASITLAQGILETESGNSDLVRKSNNHFGIKCKSTWRGESVTHDDDELGECFRSYKNWEDSYKDHSDFLRNSSRYASLFSLDPLDYKSWSIGLRKAGYATNPRYPDMLINSIEKYNLQQYSLNALNKDYVINNPQNISPESTVMNSPQVNSVVENKPTQTIIETKTQTIIEPNSITSINGSRVLFALKGTSLLAIATDNKINLSRLLSFNDLKNDGLLQNDQFIFLEKKQKEGTTLFVIVAPGENLYDISQNNGIFLKSLCEFNHLSADAEISAGTKLYLKPQTLVMQNSANNLFVKQMTEENNSSNNNNQSINYEVKPKEGLYSIAKKFGVTVSQIKEWNSLEGDNLKIGQNLIILK
jgi:LysM repeat protein